MAGIYKKIPKVLRPKVEIYNPPAFEYQDTTADTMFHYKFDQDDWIEWNSQNVIWDSSSRGYHFTENVSVNAEKMSFGHPAPPNLTQTTFFDYVPYATPGDKRVAIGTNDYAYYGEPVIQVVDDFTILMNVMLVTHPEQAWPVTESGPGRKSDGILFMMYSVDATPGNTLLAYLYTYPGDIFLVMEQYLSVEPPGGTYKNLVVRYRNATKKLKLNRWHQIVNIFDRDSLTPPKLIIDGKEMDISTDFGPFDPDIEWTSLYSDLPYAPGFYGSHVLNAFGGDLIFWEGLEPLYYGELWFNLGTEYKGKR